MAEALFDEAFNELYLKRCRNALDCFGKALKMATKFEGEIGHCLTRYVDGVMGIGCEYRDIRQYTEMKDIFVCAYLLFKKLGL